MFERAKPRAKPGENRVQNRVQNRGKTQAKPGEVYTPHTPQCFRTRLKARATHFEGDLLAAFLDGEQCDAGGSIRHRTPRRLSACQTAFRSSYTHKTHVEHKSVLPGASSSLGGSLRALPFGASSMPRNGFLPGSWAPFQRTASAVAQPRCVAPHRRLAGVSHVCD
jgi:hypothetical protein